MTRQWIGPDEAAPGFVDGVPVDPEGNPPGVPASWTSRRDRVAGCGSCGQGGPWHDPSPRCVDRGDVHCTCGVCW